MRILANLVAQSFIKEAGGAVATSSANRTGEDPTLDAQSAYQVLQGRVSVVLDGGAVYHGSASTIVDCTSTPVSIVRQGPITLADFPPDLKIQA